MQKQILKQMTDFIESTTTQYTHDAEPAIDMVTNVTGAWPVLVDDDSGNAVSTECLQEDRKVQPGFTQPDNLSGKSQLTNPKTPKIKSEPRDYGEVRFKAVVDWAELEISTAKSTNFWTVQKALREAQGLSDVVNPYVIGYDISTGMEFAPAKRNTPTTLFRFRIQDPANFQGIEAVLAKIKVAFDLQNAPKLTGIEIALDAYNSNAEQAARFYKFVTLLVSDNRRIYRDKKDKVQHVPSDLNSTAQYLSDGWQIGVGDKDSIRYQHIYWKTTDNNGDPIPESEYRARIEITLRGAALPSTSLANLAFFDFANLTEFFRFRMLKATLEPLLQVCADAAEQLGERTPRNRKEGGIRLYSKMTQADTALNGRARDALKGLMQRWQTQPKPTVRPTKNSTETMSENESACGNTGELESAKPHVC